MTNKLPEPIYVCGPMSYFMDYNKDEFKAACRQLRDAGYVVMSPHEVKLDSVPENEHDKWAAFMRADIVVLLQCKSVVVLEHWQSSRGCQLEVHIAHALKMPVLPWDVAFMQALR